MERSDTGASICCLSVMWAQASISAAATAGGDRRQRHRQVNGGFATGSDDGGVRLYGERYPLAR